MKNRLKIIIASLALVFCLLPAAPVSANFNIFEEPCKNTASKDSPACQADGSDTITGRNGILYRVNRILALIAGIAAVVVIIVGGFMYVVADGDSGKTKTARTAIISAVVGLLVIAVSQVIVAIFINIVN